MHELSMAQALVDQVEQLRVRENADQVISITVNIGALSGVEREAFEFAFPFAVEGTALAGAALVIEETPAEIVCETCGVRSRPDLPLIGFFCAQCGSGRVRITAGRDFVIQSLQLRGA